MANDDKILKVITRLENDQQSAQKAEAEISQYERSVEQLQKDQESLDRSYRDARATETRVAEGRRDAARATREVTDETERATRATREYEDAVEQANRADQGRGQGGRFSGAIDAVDRTSSVGAQVLGGLNQGDAANAAGLIGDIAGSFASLNPVMLATVGIGVGVSAIFGDIQRKMQEAEEAGQKYVQAQKEVNDLVATGATSEDIQRRIQEIEAQRSGAQATLDQLEDFQSQLQEIDDSFQGIDSVPDQLFASKDIFDQLEELTGGYVTSQAELAQAILQAKGEVESTTGPLALLNLALNSTAVEANDAAAAAEAQAEAEQKRADERAANEIAAANQALQIDRMTATQREERARQVEREIELLQREIDTGNASGKAADDLGDRILALNGEYLALTTVTESYADVLDRQKRLTEALKEGTDQVIDAQERYVDAREAATEADQAYTDALTKHQSALQSIEDDLRERERVQREQDNTQRLEAERKQYLEREKIAEETLDRINEAELKAGNEIRDARARRDVVSAIAADRARREEERLAAKDAEKRLDDLDDQTREEERIRQQRSEESLRNARTQAQKAVQLENERARAELTTRAQAAQAAAAQVTNTENNILAIQQYYDNLMIQQAAATGQSLADALFSPLGGRYTGGAGNYQTTLPIGVSKGGTAQVTIVGQTPKQVGKQVEKTLRNSWS